MRYSFVYLQQEYIGTYSPSVHSIKRTEDKTLYFFQLIYFGFGTQQIVQRDCEGLEKKIDLFLDNRLVQLPELQSIVFLNIDSWGAGCKLCGKHM